MFRLTWTDVALALLLAIPATAIPDTAPRAESPVELAQSGSVTRL